MSERSTKKIQGIEIHVREQGTARQRPSSSGRCPDCGGSGWIFFQKDGADCVIDGVACGDAGVMYDYQRRCPTCNGGKAIVAFRKTQAQIPAAFYDVAIGDFDWTIYEDADGHKIDTTMHRKLVDSFLNHPEEYEAQGIGLYIWSNTRGCGKTFLASAICNTLIAEKHKRTLFASASDLIAYDKESNDKYATDQIQRLCDADLLVIDDLGQQNNGNKWLEDILYRILDYRMQRKMLTIVTSNMALERLPFDDRITDRLEKMTYKLPLPDFCVRTRESNQKKRELMKRLGIIGGDKRDVGEDSNTTDKGEDGMDDTLDGDEGRATA